MIPGGMAGTNRDATVVANEALGGPFVVLTFTHPEVARDGRAGQFVMVKPAGSTAPLLRRPFSLLDTDPAGGTFRVFLKAVGTGSRALASLRPGDAVQCLGPLGRPFTVPPESAEALLVAGGYGIAPFHLFGRQLLAAGRRCRVFYGGRTASDLQILGLFERLGVAVTLATEDGSLGHRGRVTEALAAHLVPPGGPATLHACGPQGMLEAVARLAAERGLPAEVSLDPWMGCGLGTCLGCVVWTQRAEESRPRYRCSCTEGPVFDAREVVWGGEEASRARREREARQAESGARP